MAKTRCYSIPSYVMARGKGKGRKVSSWEQAQGVVTVTTDCGHITSCQALVSISAYKSSSLCTLLLIVLLLLLFIFLSRCFQ